MAIQSGAHLGPYEILSGIGGAGLGEVYRDVAIWRDSTDKSSHQDCLTLSKDADPAAT